jgi:hypothetical protein
MGPHIRWWWVAWHRRDVGDALEAHSLSAAPPAPFDKGVMTCLACCHDRFGNRLPCEPRMGPPANPQAVRRGAAG